MPHFAPASICSARSANLTPGARARRPGMTCIMTALGLHFTRINLAVIPAAPARPRQPLLPHCTFTFLLSRAGGI